MTDTLIVRYGEIGTKSEPVRGKMTSILRQRVADRLEHEGFDCKVGQTRGRIYAETGSREAAKAVAEIPGVSSVSPAIGTEASIGALKEASSEFEYGDTFGIKVNTAGDTISGEEVKIELGSHVEGYGLTVDLDNPDTWLEVDARGERAYIFAERFEGPDGYPVGSEYGLLALISGGIDSPVAAYEVMKRGCDITPIYFYNKPIAAEDHLLRFEAAVQKLKKYHPGKKWTGYIVDMDEVNEELMKVGKGRMVAHRAIMFRTAEKIAEKKNLPGLVTGESLGQKSSQTPENLALTSSQVDLPIHRPLLTKNKNEIIEGAKKVGSYEEATIASACSTMAPDSPATRFSQEKLDELDIDIDSLVEKALENTEEREL